ncbi:hypothetical protein [Mesorhizobium sp. Cs1321R2N1]|uniref:hypothetical protein n=1 Tax=Mesorhizobium sp. Cs1321R2N1 TaxID=3015174 RepID=UPI00301B97AF
MLESVRECKPGRFDITQESLDRLITSLKEARARSAARELMGYKQKLDWLIKRAQDLPADPSSTAALQDMQGQLNSIRNASGEAFASDEWKKLDKVVGDKLTAIETAEPQHAPTNNAPEDDGGQPNPNASSFRGIQLGMTEAQLGQALDHSFALKSEIPAPKSFGERTDGGPNVLEAAQGSLFIVKDQEPCGNVTFRKGRADRLELYQCYFDIAGRMALQDFAQQLVDNYGLERGMEVRSEIRGSGSLQYESVWYVGVRQAASERFTASADEWSGSLNLTVERIAHVNFN